MIKAWFVSLGFILLFAMAYSIDLFDFLSSRGVMYAAFGLIVVMLIVAGIILGNPLKRDKEDDKGND